MNLKKKLIYTCFSAGARNSVYMANELRYFKNNTNNPKSFQADILHTSGIQIILIINLFLGTKQSGILLKRVFIFPPFILN